MLTQKIGMSNNIIVDNEYNMAAAGSQAGIASSG